ncbi:MAG: alpha-amylase family glycosyl hydrolase [Pseudomonadota bacterium]
MRSLLPALAFACALWGGAAGAMDHVAWSRNANIYEVNVRQHSPEGTLAAVTRDLARLRALGVDIVWLMPVQPIGIKNRKGTLGSYYAVRDYTAVNPEFGTLGDMRALVKQAHSLGMHVILDWVANHTAWDHPWTTQHKDWYKHDDKGEIYSVTYSDDGPVEHWTDVVGLDYTQPGLWRGMTEAMAFWLRETDIDGFRCDVAHWVPVPFWNHARAQLDKIKPVFMLAEAKLPALHDQAFDMTYGWDLADILKKVAKGQANARELKALFTQPPVAFPAHAYRMRFTNNHDIDSWQGSDAELYGPAFRAMAVIAATVPGMPLIYGGQESGLDKRLAFFEKDPVAWKQYQHADFYRGLLQQKKDNPALWNGQYGGAMQVIDTGNDQVFAFRRTREHNVVNVAVNLSATPQRYTVMGVTATLPPWDWLIAAGRTP